MTRRLLDLCCGAGGAARGYAEAGFEVVGIDIAPQKHYPFDFYQADAMAILAGDGIPGTCLTVEDFDAIHASWPCQGYSRMRHLPWLKDKQYPLLIEEGRTLMQATRLSWVIENVEDAPMPYSIVLCGWSLGLPLYRHRRFGSNVMLMAPPHQRHPVVIGHGRRLNDRKNLQAEVAGVVPSRTYKAGLPTIVASPAGHTGGNLAAAKKAMGIDWMTRDELTQAVPPAYTRFVGLQLMEFLQYRETSNQVASRWSNNDLQCGGL